MDFDPRDFGARAKRVRPVLGRVDDTYILAGTRVSLDSIVHAFLSGASAESIAQAFPVLNLEQVYGAITYYLAHRQEVNLYLDARQREFEAQREASRKADPMFYRKLADARSVTRPARFRWLAITGATWAGSRSIPSDPYQRAATARFCST